jgi:hypothetical protein
MNSSLSKDELSLKPSSRESEKKVSPGLYSTNERVETKAKISFRNFMDNIEESSLE